MGLRLAAPVLVLLCLPGALWSLEDTKGKGKSPKIISVDLNKLPAGLAKQLLKHRAEAQKDAPKPQAKGKGKGAKTKGKRKELPRGLAKKPADHPGRVNFEKRAQDKSSKPPPKSGKSPNAPPKKKKKKSKKKKKDDDDSDN